MQGKKVDMNMVSASSSISLDTKVNFSSSEI